MLAILDANGSWTLFSKTVAEQWYDMIDEWSRTDDGRADVVQVAGLVEHGWAPEQAFEIVQKLRRIHRR